MNDALAGGPALVGNKFNPTFREWGEDLLTVVVGYLLVHDDEDPTKWIDMRLLDFDVRFCPFCGTQLSFREQPAATSH
jgi:hypothetical protein